jgi:hypothetical protein
VDYKYGLTLRKKHAIEDFHRLRPYWQKRIKAFTESMTGRATLWSLFIWMIFSGVLFRALNLLFIIWWVLPLAMLPLSRLNAQKAKDARSAGQQRGQQSSWGARRGQHSRQSDYQEGPVIDAEWVSVDSGDRR